MEKKKKKKGRGKRGTSALTEAIEKRRELKLKPLIIPNGMVRIQEEEEEEIEGFNNTTFLHSPLLLLRVL